jgi:hypothetical protein
MLPGIAFAQAERAGWRMAGLAVDVRTLVDIVEPLGKSPN